VDPALFPAALGHRGNTHVPLQFISTPEPFPLLTEGGQQAWGKLRAGTRQVLEQRIVRQRARYRGDLVLELQDCSRHGPMIAGSSVSGAASRIDPIRALIRLALRQWCAWKNASRVAVRACLTERSVGQRSRKFSPRRNRFGVTKSISIERLPRAAHRQKPQRKDNAFNV
jgi:hypothetical protein